MSSTNWDAAREALTAAIRDALPLQVQAAGGGRIDGVALCMDACYGSAGLYLLSESAVEQVRPELRDSLGDWPISTDWRLDADHALAFKAHWDSWSDWFYALTEKERTDEESEHCFRQLLRISCEAMQAVEREELFASLPKTEGFRLIVAEHDEPNEIMLDRYNCFLKTGQVRVYEYVYDPP